MNSENEDTTKSTTGYLIRTRSQTDTKQDKIEEETIATKTMAATKDEVEALLREYRNNKPRSAEPGVFTGGISENAREWLNNFESYASLNDLSEKDKILTFSLLLKAGAKLFFNNIPEHECKSWNNIKECFKATYLDSNKWIISQRIENKRLLPGESCEKYISDMTELSLLVGMEDNEFQKCLIRGLPEQLKWHVVGFNPKTVEETVQRILLGDATLQWATKKIEINAVEAKDWKMADILEKMSTRLDALESDRGRTNHSTATCHFREHQTPTMRHHNDTYQGYSWRNNNRQRYPSDYQPGFGNNGYKSAAGRGSPFNRHFSGISYKHGFDQSKNFIPHQA